MPTPRRGNLSLDEEQQNGSGGFETENEDVEVVNLEDVDENVQFEVIPPSIYRAVVENVEYTHAKSSGNPMLTWQFRVFIPQDDPDLEDRERVLFYYTPLTEKGYPRLKKAIMRLNPDQNLREFRPREAAYDLVGKECRLNIRVELDRNDRTQKRNTIKDVLEPEEDTTSQYFRD